MTKERENIILIIDNVLIESNGASAVTTSKPRILYQADLIAPSIRITTSNASRMLFDNILILITCLS